MKGLSFDLRGKIAHFRRPDTTATHMSYPFIPPTAVKGLVGAILGLEDFVTQDKIGIELLAPIRMVAQQMSMLGKDSGSSFNRPTTIELLVNPGYRIYYAGDEYVEPLLNSLLNENAVYHTYLGIAYAITKPILYKTYEFIKEIENLESVQTLEVKTVLPTALVNKIIMEEDKYYCRAGGYMYEYKGNRIFEKSVDFLYEKEGKTIRFIPKTSNLLDLKLCKFGEDLICLL